MIEKVTAYKCGFCYRCFGRPVDAANHESYCRKNPIRKHCQTCVHGIYKIIDWMGYPVADKPIFEQWCNYFNKPISDKPYFEACDTEDRYGQGEEHPVPGSCWYYEYKGCAGFEKMKARTEKNG